MKNKLFSFYGVMLLLTGLILIPPSYTTDYEENVNPHPQLSCFLIKEGGQFLVQEGDCEVKTPPACTFNIALSVIGFQQEVLKDAENPHWPYKSEYNATRDILKQSHDPKSWMKNSCVWFSQVLVQKIGKNIMEQYLNLFNYGNQDLSAYKSNDLNLPRFWISSSLKISPLDQLIFLEKLITLQFNGISADAIDFTREIICIEDLLPDLPHEWKLYGKTGAGNKLNPDGNQKKDHKYGWFVGWLENKKENKKYFFVRYREDIQPGPGYPSLTAKEDVKEKLQLIVNQHAAEPAKQNH